MQNISSIFLRLEGKYIAAKTNYLDVFLKSKAHKKFYGEDHCKITRYLQAVFFLGFLWNSKNSYSCKNLMTADFKYKTCKILTVVKSCSSLDVLSSSITFFDVNLLEFRMICDVSFLVGISTGGRPGGHATMNSIYFYVINE